jgi:hypothetical protein
MSKKLFRKDKGKEVFNLKSYFTGTLEIHITVALSYFVDSISYCTLSVDRNRRQCLRAWLIGWNFIHCYGQFIPLVA